MKVIDLTDQIFGYLHVDRKAGLQNHHVIWECTCKCGNKVFVTTGDLKQGKTKQCGCWKKEQSKKNAINEIGNIYERLTVVKRAGTNNDGKALWLCKCSCGNEITVSGRDLRSGKTKSCGCYNKDIVQQLSLHDLQGMRFGMLTVIKRAKTKHTPSGQQSTQWLCKCDCGNYKIIAATSLVTKNHTRSCGCIKTSLRENEIKNVLNHLHTKYTTEFSFEDLLSPKGYPLRFDFALFDNNDNIICLIEHQGEQHYIKTNNGFGDLQRTITDDLKRQYCKTKNVPLFEIKFNDDIVSSIHNILSKINISHVNSVPSLRDKEG